MKNSLVVIIEDDEGVLESLKAILEFGKLQVKALESFEKVPEQIKALQPSLILIDYLLAGKDGKEIIKSLKQDPETKKVPIIMLSAHPQAQQASIEAGADSFLAKPFDMNELLEKIKQLGIKNR